MHIKAILFLSYPMERRKRNKTPTYLCDVSFVKWRERKRYSDPLESKVIWEEDEVKQKGNGIHEP